jgi:diguanylate cyclase (GGDEF)-like protein
MTEQLSTAVPRIAVAASGAEQTDRLSERLLLAGYDALGYSLDKLSPAEPGQQSPALVVLQPDSSDCDLGLALTAALTRDQQLPVIWLGSRESPDDEQKALEAGAWDYLPEGLSVVQLRLRLDRCLRLADRLRTQAASIERLTVMSLTDDVTGLYNQRCLVQRLDEEWGRARRYKRPLSAMMLDIDGFKLVNDRTNHLFGTQVLREFGHLLRASLRQADILFRYGGDEFCVVLPEVGLQSTLLVAERLRTSTAEHLFRGQGWTTRITVSVGVAAYPEFPVTTAVDLLRLADEGLYLAKQTGRNRAATPPDRRTGRFHSRIGARLTEG